MDRQEALSLLKTHLMNDQLIKHSIATEAIMAAIALEAGENPERWGLIGLLHDIDFELTRDTPQRHTLEAETILRAAGFDDDFISIIQSHNAEEIGRQRERQVEFALSAAESITGMVVAAALVHPDKKIAAVKASSIRKRMKDKAFARAVSRERILECERAGIKFERFVELSLESMAAIGHQLGL
jgi:uncharacterized protein